VLFSLALWFSSHLFSSLSSSLLQWLEPLLTDRGLSLTGAIRVQRSLKPQSASHKARHPSAGFRSLL
jgi:hypothetical protein